MALKLFIKQPHLKDKSGANQHIRLDQGRLVYDPSPLPAYRQLDCYPDFVDVTGHVSDLYKLKLNWTQERSGEGLPTTGPANQKKAASGTLIFEGRAYDYMKKWLMDDDSAVMNTLEIKIEDTTAGNYLNWEVKSTDISWCDGDTCTLDATLKQKDEALTCIGNTWIADDWQGWFGDSNRPTNGWKKHPRFSYCNEVRPNGMLITLWWTMTQLMSVLGPLMLVIGPVINSIVFTLKFIIYPIINLILGILGKKKLDKDKLNYIEYKDIKEIFGNFFLESGGCGREHPAPLIRDYIQNVCSKCGVSVGPGSAPIFFAETILMETYGDREKNKGAQPHNNPHYNACYFNGVVDKGIRRFDNLNIFSGATKNLTDWWLPGNTPLLTLDAFLDQLKALYNADWRLENNTLYFQRKDFWLENRNVFDFAPGSVDNARLLTGICYEWDEGKSPLYAKGLYSADPADVCGNNAQNHMNGYASFGNIDLHPGLDGVLDKTTSFGATKFRLDGASNDYLFDAMQQVINTSLITGSVWTTPLFSTVNGFFRDYANYALLLKQETAAMPKVLIWDGQSFENAKCVQPYHASVSLGQPTPGYIEQYNPTKQLWEHRHEPQTSVSGRKLVPPPQPKGIYEVLGLFGALVTRQAAKLVNYPMYFEPGYYGNMWDWFHWIDDPNVNPKRHQRFTVKIELCADTLKRLQPFGNGTGIVLGQKVRLPLKNNPEGRITDIEISYDTSADLGPYIQLKGIV